jgi:predicted membrane protein
MNDTSSRKEEQRAIQRIRSLKDTGISGTFLDFIHFLLDFNIIGYTAGFVIAVSASELFNSVGRAIVKTSLRALHLSDYMNDLLENLIAFVIVVVLVFFLMYVVIQPIVASREVQEERKVKKVLKTAEDKKIEQTAELVKSPSNKIPFHEPSNGMVQQDGFSNIYSMF